MKANERKAAWQSLQQRKAVLKAAMTMTPVLSAIKSRDIELEKQNKMRPGYSFKGDSRQTNAQNWHRHEV